MFGVRKTTSNSSTTMIYLVVCFLLVNQFLVSNSFRLMYQDSDEYEPEDAKRAVFERFGYENSLYPEKFSFNNHDLQPLVKSKVERRFCCMSPLLSGRKRSIRDLTREKLAQQ